MTYYKNPITQPKAHRLNLASNYKSFKLARPYFEINSIFKRRRIANRYM